MLNPRVDDVRDGPRFQSESIRERTFAPLWERLGYGHVGDNRVLRSKSLTQPFLEIGMRSVPISLVPDYTLYHRDTPVLILDTKSPSEHVAESELLRQAYGYALHPEIGCRHFALCNDRELVLYHIDVAAPVMRLSIDEWEARWDDIVRHLSPESLFEPRSPTLHPDAGWRAVRLGVPPDAELAFTNMHVQLMGRLSDDHYSMSSSLELPGGLHLASFDFPASMVDRILGCLDRPLRDAVVDALTRWPFQASLDHMVAVDCRAHLAESVAGEQEVFVPFVVDEIIGSRLVGDPPLASEDTPSYLFGLRRSTADR